MASDIRIAEDGALGHLTLDRPKALNALTPDMIGDIDAALTRWQGDDRIRVVLIDGAGEKAFCAGGDIRMLYEAVGGGRIDDVASFYKDEYRLNARLARFPKPIVTVMHGLTMGGGIGIGAHAAHRIVTDTSKLAMPEVMIGFFPDVGGTYLLGMAPGELGTHAALTGGTLAPADALACGLADRFVETVRLEALRGPLSQCRSESDVRKALDDVTSAPATGLLSPSADWIARCYAGDDVTTILERLTAAPEPAAAEALERLRAACPTALKVTLRALRAARHLGRLEPCLDQELRLSLRMVSRPDFREGVRAAVIDKDKTPRWRPARLDQVDSSEIEACFASLGEAELGLA